jgi:hypothetical protein
MNKNDRSIDGSIEEEEEEEEEERESSINGWRLESRESRVESRDSRLESRDSRVEKKKEEEEESRQSHLQPVTRRQSQSVITASSVLTQAVR